MLQELHSQFDRTAFRAVSRTLQASGALNRWIAALLCCLSCLSTAVAAEGPQTVGVTGCVRCHRQPSAADAELDYSRDVLNFAGLDQATTWEKFDKHRLAVTNLFGDRGLRMIEQLEKVPLNVPPRDLSDAAYRETLKSALLQSRECLSCHADWRAGETAPDVRQLTFGVQCEACHGGAEQWYLPHTKPEWRKVAPEVKHKTFGMIDVRSPVVRAERCLSCHVGNVAEGKVLTHAMYAAGHPRLPQIEIESFLEQMPPHWRDLNAKPDFQFREEFARVNGHRADDLPHSRGVALSAIVALQHAVDNLTARVRMEEGDLDFAEFRCADCHHDLRRNSWRPQGQRPGERPTRPRLAHFSGPLVDLALRQSSSTAEQFVERRRALQTAIERFQSAVIMLSPEGVAEIDAPARELQALLRDTLTSAADHPFTKDAARSSLELLLNPDLESRLDFDAARQIAWGARIIASELKTARLPLNAERQPRVESPLGHRTTLDARILELFSKTTALDSQLVLDLATGPNALSEQQIHAVQRAASTYDPRRFLIDLQLLRAELQTELAR